MAEFIEHNWNGNEGKGDKAEERAGPVDAKGVEHVRAEEGKDAAADRTEEGVSCDGGGGAAGKESVLYKIKGEMEEKSRHTT